MQHNITPQWSLHTSSTLVLSSKAADGSHKPKAWKDWQGAHKPKAENLQSWQTDDTTAIPGVIIAQLFIIMIACFMLNLMSCIFLQSLIWIRVHIGLTEYHEPYNFQHNYEGHNKNYLGDGNDYTNALEDIDEKETLMIAHPRRHRHYQGSVEFEGMSNWFRNQAVCGVCAECTLG